MTDFLDQLFPRNLYGKPKRPSRDLSLFHAGVRKSRRHLRSFLRGRIGHDEYRRRAKLNYQRTGAYFGPAGWIDD